MGLFSIFKGNNQHQLDHPFRRTSFKPNGSGKASAFLFDNPRTDMVRNLYWTFQVALDDIDYLEETWPSNVTFDWFTIKPGAAPFHSSHTTSSKGSCSWYLNHHIPAKSWELSWTHGNTYKSVEISFKACFDFPGFDGDPCTNIEISGTTELVFTGISVSRNNFFPKPNTEDDARQMLVPCFPDIERFGFLPPEDEDGWPIQNPNTFLFVPK